MAQTAFIRSCVTRKEAGVYVVFFPRGAGEVRAGHPGHHRHGEAEHARLLAHLLVTNDLRGVFSHGSRKPAPYVRALRDRALNPRPQIRVRDETPTTFAVDGD